MNVVKITVEWKQEIGKWMYFLRGRLNCVLWLPISNN